MTLAVYNTMTRVKEPFVPLDPGHVRMYVCGPTVYDRAHIGNARPVVVFDTLYRLLKRTYPRVTYARNITDVDDKINARAAESGRSIRDNPEEPPPVSPGHGGLTPCPGRRAARHRAHREMLALIGADRQGARYAAKPRLCSVASMPTMAPVAPFPTR